MLTKFFIITTLFSFNTFAIGFSNGNEFKVTPISGQVFVHCQNGTTQFNRCYAEAFDPAESDFFLGPQGTDANSINLKCTRQDGSVETKNSPYDGVSGRSTKRFNLWIKTLFQTPLLDIGTNKINFDLLKNGKSVQSGEFTATVKEGPGIACRQGDIWENGSQDLCRNNYSACQIYFDQNNYCL